MKVGEKSGRRGGSRDSITLQSSLTRDKLHRKPRGAHTDSDRVCAQRPRLSIKAPKRGSQKAVEEAASHPKDPLTRQRSSRIRKALVLGSLLNR